MHFYPDALKIVSPNACMENYQIKTLLSAIFDFLFFLHLAQRHSFILNFWSWGWGGGVGLREDSSPGSIIVNEGIRALLNLFIFFYKKISHAQKAQNTYKRTKTKKQHFYAHKKYLRGRKSLVWRFVLFMFFMFIKNI